MLVVFIIRLQRCSSMNGTMQRQRAKKREREKERSSSVWRMEARKWEILVVETCSSVCLQHTHTHTHACHTILLCRWAFNCWADGLNKSGLLCDFIHEWPTSIYGRRISQFCFDVLTISSKQANNKRLPIECPLSLALFLRRCLSPIWGQIVHHRFVHTHTHSSTKGVYVMCSYERRIKRFYHFIISFFPNKTHRLHNNTHSHTHTHLYTLSVTAPLFSTFDRRVPDFSAFIIRCHQLINAFYGGTGIFVV